MKILLSSAKTIALFTEAFQVASEATNYSRDGEGMPIKKNAVLHWYLTISRRKSYLLNII